MTKWKDLPDWKKQRCKAEIVGQICAAILCLFIIYIGHAVYNYFFK